MAALLWGVPGCIITSKGVAAYRAVAIDDLWWLILCTVTVLVAFYFMFRRVVARYSGRIAKLPSKARLWQTFPLRGWILMLFMMSLGVALKHIPAVPLQFTASFYSGLGPMLLLSSARFLCNVWR
ncbi:MAG: hypothetical protein J6K81_06005 [Rikenellaceae bacterium]|nr:hypothetical protein [Rikenellaceae bacterium]